MKKLIILLNTAILFTVNAQTPQWFSKQGLPTTAKRALATSFSIADKVYVIGGATSSACLYEVWQYDINTNSWLQKNDFPGAARKGITAFAVNGKGYLVGGNDCNKQYLDEVWEYTPATDSWTKKSNFTGGGREEAAGFVIGNKAYFGTGYAESYGPNNTTTYAYNDFWEYSPATDTWLQKANVPGQERGWAISSALNGKGYLGLGSNSLQTISFNDFYEYDPTTDIWTSKANYPLGLGDAMCFNYGSEIYVCGGINFSSYVSTSSVKSYNPITNTWTNQSAMGGGNTMGAVAVNANGRAFVGTGYTSALNERADLWEYGILNTTSLQESKNKQTQFYVFPNPGSGTFNVHLPASENPEQYLIKLHDLMGREAACSLKTINEEEFQIELVNPVNGIYFLTIENQRERIVKKLLVE